jgi:2'-5' RNA ligase
MGRNEAKRWVRGPRRGKSVTIRTVAVSRMDLVRRRTKRGTEREERAERCEVKRSEERRA